VREKHTVRETTTEDGLRIILVRSHIGMCFQLWMIQMLLSAPGVAPRLARGYLTI